jgi:hypothetical protein
VDDGGGHGSLIHSRCGGRRSKVEVGSVSLVLVEDEDCRKN